MDLEVIQSELFKSMNPEILEKIESFFEKIITDFATQNEMYYRLGVEDGIRMVSLIDEIHR